VRSIEDYAHEYSAESASDRDGGDLWKLTAFKVPLQRPTPTVAPVMHMEVETGRENCEKTRTVIAAPISIEEPEKDHNQQMLC
jgi:hypothetical protein